MATPSGRPTGRSIQSAKPARKGSNGRLTRGFLVGDTGFEPVTSSVSGQSLCLGRWAIVASGACAGIAYVCRRAGWLADGLADSQQGCRAWCCKGSYPGTACAIP